jgi:hypothetical protein
MSNQKKTVYRHPVTNKFISKKQWEELKEKYPVKDSTQLTGSDYDLDPKYIEDTKKFMKEIEREFDELVKPIPSKEEEHPSGWKLFLNKLKFWV